MLPQADEIAADIVFEDITADSLSISFSANPGITQYTTDVYSVDEDGELTLVDQIITNIDE